MRSEPPLGRCGGARIALTASMHFNHYILAFLDHVFVFSSPFARSTEGTLIGRCLKGCAISPSLENGRQKPDVLVASFAHPMHRGRLSQPEGGICVRHCLDVQIVASDSAASSSPNSLGDRSFVPHTYLIMRGWKGWVRF